MSRETAPSPAAGDFWNPKTLEALIAEQGVRPVADPAELLGRAADCWPTDEEFEDFLAGVRRGRAEGA